MLRRFARVCLFWMSTWLTIHAAPQRVAILGDSITFDGRWATRVESALRGTTPFEDAEIVNFGLSSETVSGLTEANHADWKFPRPCLFERLDRVLNGFKPDLVIACYGMNDGIYQPLDETRTKAFQDGIVKLKTAVENHGSHLVIVTPPLFHADQPADDPQQYDAVLEHYAQWLVSLRAQAWNVVDIRADIRRDVAAAKQQIPGFIYAADGIHPGEQGHEFIANSICKQLWPILKLPDAPRFANPVAMKILKQRNDILKLAWLSKTHHLRPGVPAGLPLEQAETQAADLLKAYCNAAAQKDSQ